MVKDPGLEQNNIFLQAKKDFSTTNTASPIKRFTGVIYLEGCPVNHKYHEAYQELFNDVINNKAVTYKFKYNVIYMNDGYVRFDKEVPSSFTIKYDDPN